MVINENLFKTQDLKNKLKKITSCIINYIYILIINPLIFFTINSQNLQWKIQ